MTTITKSPLMKAEEFLALPDDGVERELIRGQLKEREMTRRGRPHSGATVNLSYLLKKWLLTQPVPHGELLGGEAAFRLGRNPDTFVGIDLAYISPEMAAANPPDTFNIDGSPILAVEILSPSDKQEDILEKVDIYLESGVKLVWIVEPVFRTISVYRPDAPPALFNETQHLSGGQHLPGFDVLVSEIFKS